MVDEWMMGNKNDDEEWLDKQVGDMKKLVELMEDNVFWIVLSRKIINEEWYESFMHEAEIKFQFPELNYTFRNTKEIIEEVKLIMNNKDEYPQLPPSRFPSYEKPVKLEIKRKYLKNETKVNEILHEVKDITEHQINTTGVLIITGESVTEEHVKCLVKCVQYTFKDSCAYFAHDDRKHLSYNKIEDFYCE